MDDVFRLPGLAPVIGSQVRYQLTLMLRTPRTLMADLILPGALLALQHSPGQSGQVLSGRDLAVLAAWALGGLLLSVRFFRWDPHRPRHARPVS